MARLTQWLCYLSAVGALCGGGWLTARYILTNGFTETTFVLLALIPLIMVFIAGIFAAPALRKVIEGEQSILK